MNYTYLMTCTKTGVFKIGKSKNPVNRLKQIKTSNPFIELYGITEIPEKKFHKKYKEYNIGGEWFEINDVKLKKDLFENFKPINLDEIRFNGCDYSLIIKKCNDLKKRMNRNEINSFSNELYKNLTKKEFKQLLNNCKEFYDLVMDNMYNSL